ncbi:unnamed protein product [Schistocephalus solidus]|uniref:Ras-related protein Rab-10 n=1 Tax=Schistocephalus solidus TaxID=70667 RepID=A0A183TN07_SCHSO|nr:unnamed protein product [Schistocephalus solidus]
MAKKSYDQLFKLMLIGDSGVGKTCILFRFVEDSFSSSFISTIGIDFKIKTVELEDQRIKLQIWDTAGQERFQTITASYYRGAMGIMLVYSVTSKKSFENIAKWMANIKNLASYEVETIIIANKADMSQQREVSSEEGKEIAERYGVRLYISIGCIVRLNILKPAQSSEQTLKRPFWTSHGPSLTSSLGIKTIPNVDKPIAFLNHLSANARAVAISNPLKITKL